ncbi:aldolase/citrate lyase family protein [Rhodococcus sp. IEGM 1401]|uniref:HpcH/HpaI aldolase/citrate lyase family protein n=1 Tax=unclassified Rhodococcus (in: high G+C Gram-positive bacteria) TaxID=192944 RepID=UPI0022B5297B|nr:MULTISPECIES: aldolase/citrate lyase family protein [unclassified Rhodococcus (in: high G+C Gram-positive bacteria)]MCZ4562886.1 aldolase/citrate lyase family protein [Rhodococcus sp. IEGM 1401]MDI9923009.1 aldolase/citrate lyase family protein [Rhodococcus sp. IEGM 1372]MDV8035519.1 aldolase/citrate lyase family protein [Rhodococcus sp. IEGM 1414]
MRQHNVVQSRVSSERSRSWMLVNGNRPDVFDDAARASADQIILDIEDAVDARFKPIARTHVTSWLDHNCAWVRINDRLSEHWSDDVDQLRNSSGLSGVVLAKAEDSSQVTETFDRLGGSIPVIALIESAIGVEESTAIAAARGTFRLAFGSGDYRRDTGASAHDSAMSYPRNKLVVASRIGKLPGPIDGPTVSVEASEVEEQALLAVALGMTGKLCVGIDHLSTINTSMSPTSADLIWAAEFLADFESRGSVIRDGSDPPRLGRARALIEHARALGIQSV